MNAVTFHDVLRGRYSVRHFRTDPVPEAEIRAVLADAQTSPSNCNTQPWDVHIVSGGKRDALSAALVEAFTDGRFSMDFSFDQAAFYDQYKARSNAQGAVYYQALGVTREDYEKRRVVGQRNLTFFDAPHVALLFVPEFGDHVRAAADIGMYAQTFLMALVAHELGGVPQTMLGMFADTVREVLEIDSRHRLLFGISFGYPDADNVANSFRMDRAAVDECVTFHA